MEERSSEPAPSQSLLEADLRLSEVAPDLISIHDQHSLSQASNESPGVKEKLRESSEDPRGDDNKAQRLFKFFASWWLEIAAALFSLACLAANVGILVHLNGAEYQSWRVANVDITPNTVVSILATLSKAGLLLPIAEGISQMKWHHFQRKARRVLDLQIFDDASRGALGSLRLLWRLKGSVCHLTSSLRLSTPTIAHVIQTLVASIGALALEPFTQQIISYYTHPTLAANESSSISATNMLSVANWHQSPSGYGKYFMPWASNRLQLLNFSARPSHSFVHPADECGIVSRNFTTASSHKTSMSRRQLLLAVISVTRVVQLLLRCDLTCQCQLYSAQLFSARNHPPWRNISTEKCNLVQVLHCGCRFSQSGLRSLL